MYVRGCYIHFHNFFRSELPPKIDDVFRSDLILLESFLMRISKANPITETTKFDIDFETRYLTYLYTCQLTSLYGLQMASKSSGKVHDFERSKVRFFCKTLCKRMIHFYRLEFF